MPWRFWGSSRDVSLLSISIKMVLLAKGDSLGWEDPEPTTCAWRALGQGRPAMPIYCNGVMCCYSNGRITDEWGKLFLLLSRLQKETKTPFTSANNALMWAPAPCSLHRPSSVQAANHHCGLWGHSQWYPSPVGNPHQPPSQAGEVAGAQEPMSMAHGQAACCSRGAGLEAAWAPW